MSVMDLLRHNLGPVSALLQEPAAADLDWDPPTPVLAALGTRTGVGLCELRLMTIAGWVPWLLDALDSDNGQESFDTYVRQHSVLLAPGEAGRSKLREARGGTVPRWRPWLFTWPTSRSARRVCPVCAVDPDRGVDLLAYLPITVSCAEHGCRLKPEVDVTIAMMSGEPLSPQPAAEHLVAMDRHTRQGLTTGAVTLPGRAVHVGVWFRLLRTLLDEVSMSLSRVSVRSRTTLEHIWREAGYPVRAGLNVWRPYEHLGGERQQAMLEAAATALHLAEAGAIAARGTLGPALAREPHRRVYDGDQPSKTEVARRVRHAEMARSWERANEEFNAAIDAARTDPAAARRILVMFTGFSRTLESFDRERQFVMGLGIPEEFLPDHRELGRTDLV
jgi:hypothetical protein